MTLAEARFKGAIVRTVALGLYPSPANIYRVMGRTVRPHRDMNGRECRWRNELLPTLGWRYVPRDTPGRVWEPPRSGGSVLVTG